jgi:hypothetical protein
MSPFSFSFTPLIASGIPLLLIRTIPLQHIPSANRPSNKAGFEKKLSRTCLDNYNPNKEQSIDEGMIAFKGRLSFKQYLPAKPTKFGIKVWKRASPQNG